MSMDNKQTSLATLPLLSLAFRPLFLAGALFAVVAIGWWVHFWLNPFSWQPHGGVIWWHGHEMLFGFGGAIAGGFLLTAVANWTGITPIRGGLLLILAVAWLIGRLLLSFGGEFPTGIVMAVDVLYLLLVAGAMAYPIIKARLWRNLVFLPLLLTLAIINGVSHWAIITGDTPLAIQSLHAAILWFVLLIGFLGGRVIPAFTSNATRCHKAQPILWLEAVSVISIILMLIIAWVGFASVPSWLLLVVASIGAVANGWRFLRWGFQHSWNVPLLWSLHLGYAFIPLGFIFLGLYSMGWMDNLSAALHSFTVGAMGGMILAMTSRVTLGHTGRPLEPPRLIILAYIAVLLAAVVRVALPAWLPALTNWGIGIAGGLWVLAFAIFLFSYAPMLVKASKK